MVRLIAHPAHPPLAVKAIEVTLFASDTPWLSLRWRIDGAGRIVVPPLAGNARADGLWKTTCFELFVSHGAGPGYSEFNFSPSERWAAYDFTDTRTGMSQRATARPPVLAWRGGAMGLALFDAALPRAALPDPAGATGIAAVIEEAGGHLSYWALAHHGPAPDFHDRACFAARLPAPGEA